MISLAQGAHKAMVDCGQAAAGEFVLIVSDDLRPGAVGRALAKAARDMGSNVEIAQMPSGGVAGGEPPHDISERMLKADLVVFATTRIMFYAEATHQARLRGARIITLTGCDVTTLTEGGIEADFRGERETCDWVTECLTVATSAQITSPAGTDLSLRLDDRKAVANYGFCDGPGSASGVPDIEAYIAPLEGTCSGRLVVDGSTSVTGLVDEPIVLRILAGRVASIEGGDSARVLRERLAEVNEPDALTVAEFAIGLNRSARVVGNIIEDEGSYGTGHFALGDNRRFGGQSVCSQHIDLVYRHPTVQLDDVALMMLGQLVRSH